LTLIHAILTLIHAILTLIHAISGGCLGEGLLWSLEMRSRAFRLF